MSSDTEFWRIKHTEASVEIAALKAELSNAKSEHAFLDNSWDQLRTKIADLDPSWTEEMGEPDPNDPDFREQYDPWEGLRLITAKLARVTEELATAQEHIGQPLRLRVTLTKERDAAREQAEALARALARVEAKLVVVLEALEKEHAGVSHCVPFGDSDEEAGKKDCPVCQIIAENTTSATCIHCDKTFTITNETRRCPECANTLRGVGA